MGIKAVKFCNYTDRDFTWKWDGVEYTFEAGTTMFLEDYKAEHFTRHLVDRELHRANILTNNLSARKPLEAKCLPASEAISPLQALNVEELKKEVVAKEAKKKGPKGKKVEVEFEDLDNE